MALFSYDAEDAELIQDFYNDYLDLYDAAESCILKLESTPNDDELLNGLFRAIHTIKGNCGLLGIMPLVDLIQQLESILDLIRKDQMQFQPLIGDLTLLVLDKCSQFVNSLERHLEANYDSGLFTAVAQQMAKAVIAPDNAKIKILTKALVFLDPTTVQISEASETDALLEKFDVDATEDTSFILHLAIQTQQRADFWDGRLERVLSWVMAFNEALGDPVEREQLFVAVCLHDISMAMLPSAVINKNNALTDDELKSVQEHVDVSSRLAKSFPQWATAKTILLHHHENYDGSGYPLGLKHNDIHVGAQLLSIVHTFEAITHGYSKSLSRKRPLMRAVMELNRFANIQFSGELVQTFMGVTRSQHVA